MQKKINTLMPPHFGRGYRWVILAVLPFAVSGCATLTNEAMQPVEFVAPYCEDKVIEVECTATNKRGSWTFTPPKMVKIRRSDDTLRVMCNAKGHGNSISSADSRMGSKLALSFAFIDFGIVDAITDKHRIYPDQVVLDACRDSARPSAAEDMDSGGEAQSE